MNGETDLMKRIMVALGKLPGFTSFRNNTGTGWQGKVENGRLGTKIIREARPLHAGLCKGSSDLIGWRSLEITPDMVGRRVAAFVAVEVKDVGGKLTDEQRAFLSAVKRAGGIALVARDPAAAAEAIAAYTLPEGPPDA